MKPIQILLAFVLGLAALPTAYSQNTSTQGKEFWLSFMHNGYKDHTSGGWVINQVLISAKRDCTGTVSNPLSGWSQDFIVSANSITTVEIPEEQGYHNSNEHERIFEKGIKVTASDTVSVYCTNIAYVSFDATFVLPVGSLGDEYIIQNCEQSRLGQRPYVWNNETTSFVIVATEDNTTIDITPTVRTLGGHSANQTFTIEMHAGETYHVRSNRLTSDPIDLSGTHIRAHDCKRIAVFNGNTVTSVPFDAGNGYDHVFEQAMPLRSWGKNFVVTSSRTRNRDFIKVTSSADNNIITKNGETLDTLHAGQSYYFPMLESEGSCYLQTTQPSAVYLYQTSHDATEGDPSMVWIAPVEQRIKDVTFSTFDHPDINILTHSVNIIVKSHDIARVYLDGELVPPSDFQSVNGNNSYSYARLDISHGVHRITCDNGFNAHVYGFGDAKGYAYLAGSNALNLNAHLNINDEAVLPHETYPFCADQELTFHADVNLNDYDLLWDFGDGSTSTENPTSHTYPEQRVYNASLIINTTDGGCDISASDTTRFRVDATQQYSIHSDEICEDECYTGHGFNNVLIHNDTILAGVQDNPVHPECQDSVLVYISTKRHITHEFDTITCGTFVWDDDTYTETDDITHTYPASNGCDSIVTCHLKMEGYILGDTLVMDTCNSFLWNGEEYPEGGFYRHNLTSQTGCDSIAFLELTLSYTPTPIITCTSPDAVVFGPTLDTVAVITNTEFFSFQYDFYVEDTDGHFNDWDSCVWSISKPSWTIEPFDEGAEPDRHYCRVHIAERSDTLVMLSVRCVNLNCVEDERTAVIYLKSSFLDIHEHNAPITTLHPNPTTGLVTITGENLLQTEVINTLGQQVLSAQGKGNELSIDMAALPAGVYFVAVTNEDGRKCVRKIVKE